MDQAGLIAARALLYATLLPAAGLPLYLLTAGKGTAAGRPVRITAAVLALLAAAATLWWLLAAIAAMAALPLGQLDRDTVAAVSAATPLGAVVRLRLAALAVLAATVLPRLPLAVPALAGLVALATAAFTGHAGASEGAIGLLHRAADILHLAAAGCWIAALGVFVAGAFGRKPATALEAGLTRFATTGTAIVAILVPTGLANTLLIAGWPVPLSTRWTAFLALKLALFAAMLGLAALNRWRLTPALGRGDAGARRALRVSTGCELACGLAVLALVAVLGSLDPAA